MRYIVYARDSTEKQNSTQDQIAGARRVGDDNALPVKNPMFRGVPHEYCGYVIDRGESGTLLHREGIDLVVQLVKEQRIHGVIVRDLYRSSRLMKQLLHYRDLFEAYGVEMVSLLDNTSSYDENSHITWMVHGFASEMFLKQLRSSTLSSQITRGSAGYNPGSIPDGYQSRGTRPKPSDEHKQAWFEIEINPERAPVIQRLFVLFSEGIGMTTLARTFNDEAIPSPGAVKYSKQKRAGRSKWTTRTISKILANPRYNGQGWFWRQFSYKKDPTTGKPRRVAVPPEEWVSLGRNSDGTPRDDGRRDDLQIVDNETWEKVQAILRENKRSRAAATDEQTRRWGRRKSKEPEHLLSGTLRCGTCGGNFFISSGKKMSDGTSGTYSCFAAHRQGGTCKQRRHVARGALERTLIGVLKDLLIDHGDIAEQVARLTNERIHRRLAEDPNSIARLREQHAQAQHEIANLLDFVAKGGAGSVSLAERLRHLEAKAEQLGAQLAGREAAQKDPLLVLGQREIDPFVGYCGSAGVMIEAWDATNPSAVAPARHGMARV